MRKPHLALMMLLATGAYLAPPAMAQDDELVVKRCRIKLIDQVVLASGQTGILKEMDLHEGSTVQEGQIVAKLDDGVPAASLAVAEKEASNDIEIRYAKKAAEVAEAEYRKTWEANQKVPGAVSAIELDRLKLTAQRAVLQIEQAEHDHALNRLRRDEAAEVLRSYHIVAPFSGTVTRVMRKRGEAVRQGEPVLELSSTARVRVEGEVDVKYMRQIKKGTPVVVSLEGVEGSDVPAAAQNLPGEIILVDLSVVPVGRNVRVLAEVPNPDNVLIAGLTATMTVQLGAEGGNPKVAAGTVPAR